MSDARTEPAPPLPNHPPAKHQGNKLASFMVTNIILLVIVAGASILLLLFGDFDGKVVRTVSTLLLFAAFTIFAAIDSTRNAPQRYVMISQVGHMYMLGISLVLIWGSLAVRRGFFDEFSILTKTLMIIALVKLGVMVVQKVSDAVYSPQPQLSLAAKFCAASLAATAVLYTLPIATDYFITYREGYWKFAVAVLLFAGLAISVTGLLTWYVSNNNGNAEQKKTVGKSVSDYSQPFRNDTDSYASQPPATAHDPLRAVQAPQHPQGATEAPRLSTGQPVTSRIESVPPKDAPSAPPSYLRPVTGPQAWPVFPDGKPLPAAQNGRPDFAVLQYVASVYAESERQWFGSGSTH